MHFLYDSQVYKEDLEQAMKQVKDWNKLNGSSVLIAGATGLIGSYMVDLFLAANKISDTNITVYALGRDRERLQERFCGVKTENLIFIEGDINESLKLNADVDYVVHGASNAHPAAFREKPVETLMSNVLGTYRLLEYGREHRAKRFLYVSSGEIYGQGNSLEKEFSEDYSGYINILEPRSCYPSGKRAAETLCCSYSQQYGLDVVIARPCHTYGPNMSDRDNRATAQFIRNALKGEDIILKSAGNQMRSYCYVADCVSALLTILLNGAPREAYTIANKDSRLTIAEFARLVAAFSGRKVVFENPDLTALQERSPIERQVLDSRKIESLGWVGNYPAEKGIEHTLKILNV